MPLDYQELTAPRECYLNAFVACLLYVSFRQLKKGKKSMCNGIKAGLM